MSMELMTGIILCLVTVVAAGAEAGRGSTLDWRGKQVGLSIPSSAAEEAAKKAELQGLGEEGFNMVVWLGGDITIEILPGRTHGGGPGFFKAERAVRFMLGRHHADFNLKRNTCGK